MVLVFWSREGPRLIGLNICEYVWFLFFGGCLDGVCLEGPTACSYEVLGTHVIGSIITWSGCGPELINCHQSVWVWKHCPMYPWALLDLFKARVTRAYSSANVERRKLLKGEIDWAIIIITKQISDTRLSGSSALRLTCKVSVGINGRLAKKAIWGSISEAASQRKSVVSRKNTLMEGCQGPTEFSGAQWMGRNQGSSRMGQEPRMTVAFKQNPELSVTCPCLMPPAITTIVAMTNSQPLRPSSPCSKPKHCRLVGWTQNHFIMTW